MPYPGHYHHGKHKHKHKGHHRPYGYAMPPMMMFHGKHKGGHHYGGYHRKRKGGFKW